MVELTALTAYLNSLLEVDRGSDACPNGLQVEGRPEVRKVVTGVSACLELFERAERAGADAVLVHHGIFWKGPEPTLTGVQYRRVKSLIDSGLGLLAYHLPLDRHPDLGNNILGARRLGLEGLKPFGTFEGEPIGFRGHYASAIPTSDFFERCREAFGQEPLVLDSGPAQIRTVGVVSGAAERALYEAIALGLDAFVTGEVSEWVQNLARESGTHFVAAGHYATERLGIRALGEHVTERFGIEAEFIDVPNPV